MSEQLATRLHALEADDALMSALVESINEGVVAVNGRGSVVRMNESARCILGRRSVPFPFLPIDCHKSLRCAPRYATRCRAQQPSLARCCSAVARLALTARPLPDGGAVLALLDLTTRRRLETIRRDFVANVSHELKTPLTVISGFAETLLDSDLSPAAARSVRRHDSIERRADAAHRRRPARSRTLRIWRLGSQSSLPSTSSPRRRKRWRSFKRRRLAGSSSCARRLRTALARATADPTALRQILQNLVENAVRYTPTGSVTVFADRKDGGTVVGVRDTGIGIPREHLPRIFERFYRVDAGRSREVGGTGLGLAIVKHLAEAHGGSVRATSTLGSGTEIAVFFPDQ